MAGGTTPDLWPGEEMLPAAQAGESLPRDAAGGRGRSEGLRGLGMGFSGRLNTAFIERGNLTVRHGVAALARRTWATSQQAPQLLAQLEWWRAYYHFVRPHASLRVRLVQPRERGGKRLAQRYRHRTPAMAAGRTHRRWTTREVLACPWVPISAGEAPNPERMQCDVAGCLVKMPAEGVGRGSRQGEMPCLDCPLTKKSPKWAW